MIMMAYVSLAVLVLSAAALGAAVLLVVGLRRQHGGRSGRAAPERPLVAVQSALGGGLLAALATAVVVMSVDAAHQDWLGVPLSLAPGLAASAGLLVVAFTPSLPTRVGSVRSASLVPRGTWTVGARAAYLRPAVVAGALVGVLLVTGLTGSADDSGLSRAFSVHRADGVNTASPYPGWFYAGPLLAVTVLLLLAATLAMRRIAMLPAPRSADEHADRAWRRSATSAISSLATAGLLAYLAGVVLVTGSAIQSAGDHTALAVAGWVLMGAAPLIGVLACACFALAIGRATTFLAALRAPAPLPR